ncbi:MAG: putative ABC transport system permease protein, partial [Roseivirga sp.]
EGILITVLGGILGFLLGHGLVEVLVSYYEKSEEIGITGMVIVNNEFSVLLLSVGVGVIAALIPAFNAYRTDISKVLAQD